MGWDGSSESYLPNALTVNKSLVLILKTKNLRVRRTDQTRPDGTRAICIGILYAYEGNEWNEMNEMETYEL